MSEAYTYNGNGVIVVVEAVFSDGVAIDTADDSMSAGRASTVLRSYKSLPMNKFADLMP